MKVMRIKLRQPMASYAVEEMVNNKISYPLPSFSTIIGALHNVCGYTEYKEMKISIQGKYSSIQREVYVNHGLLDSIQDDRGNLIWLYNPDSFNGGYIPVAKAIKDTGNSFKERKTISIFNEEKLAEYINLYEKDKELKEIFNNEIEPKKKEWKNTEKELKLKMKALDKNYKEYKKLDDELKEGKKEIKKLENNYQEKRYAEYDEPKSHFKTLTKGPQTCEVLYDVELVIHVAASDEVFEDIAANQNNFVSLGRSEDFIELQEIKLVDITDIIDDEYGIENDYMLYANVEKVDDKVYFKSSNVLGTVYYVSKDYQIKNGKRVFNKIPCLCTSYLNVDGNSSKSGIYIDKDEKTTYIVDLN